jgi:hypothetical protein
MRYLYLLLTIPFLSAQAAAPTCDKLRDIAADLEKSIQSKHFAPEVCDKMDAASLGLPTDSIGFSGDWDYRCKDYSAIDMQLKSIENEIALLKGIDSLKTEIKEGLATIAKVKNPEQAKEASASFVKNLDVARSIELFLGTNNAQSENILAKLAEDKNGWTDINSFKGLLITHCRSFNAKGTVCENGFFLSEDTFKEIDGFIKVGKNTERKFSKDQVKDLTNAMKINKGDDPYSFGQISSDLKKELGPNGLLSPEDVQKIKELPELSNDKGFDFLKKLKASIKDIKESEALVHAQATPTRFTSILNDLKKRQEWEIKSKFSLVMNQYGEHLPDEVAEVCTSARELKGSIEDCLTPLQKSKKLKSFEQAAVIDLIAEFKYGEAQVTKLNDLLKDCIPDQTLVYPAKCEGIVTQQMADLTAKAQVLNTLKAKHLQENADLITFRNFALEKLHSKECMNAEESNITNCYADIGNISREAIVLTKDTNDIIYVFEKPAAPTEVAELCLNSDVKVSFKKDLCKLTEEDPSKKKTNDDNYEAPVSPDSSGNPVGQALFDLGSSILNSIAGYLAPPVQQVNPYGPVFPYVQPIAQPKDISSQIMDPYLSSGFGNYYPTQGLRPYSSVSSNLGTSSAYDFGGSSHFNSPVGW